MTQIRNILLIGRTGNGKSTLANVLSGTEKFKESPSGVAVTMKVQTEEFELEVMLGGNDNNLKIKFRVIDTIGIGDTSLKPKEVLTEIANACDILKDGLYQVFFVIGGKFTDEEIEAYNLIKEIFDDQIVKFTTIVRTKFPEFEQEESCTEEKNKLSGENPKLAELISLCNGIVHVDNLPMKERYVDISREVRDESRKRLILHLMNNCENYFLVSLAKLNQRISDYKTKEEILRERIEQEARRSKEQYESTNCSIS